MSKTIKDIIDNELPLKKGAFHKSLLAIVDTLESIPHYNKREFQKERLAIQNSLSRLSDEWLLTEIFIDTFMHKIKTLLQEETHNE